LAASPPDKGRFFLFGSNLSTRQKFHHPSNFGFPHSCLGEILLLFPLFQLFRGSLLFHRTTWPNGNSPHCDLFVEPLNRLWFFFSPFEIRPSFRRPPSQFTPSFLPPFFLGVFCDYLSLLKTDSCFQWVHPLLSFCCPLLCTWELALKFSEFRAAT